MRVRITRVTRVVRVVCVVCVVWVRVWIERRVRATETLCVV